MYIAFFNLIHTVKMAKLEPNVIKPQFSTVLLYGLHYYNDIDLLCTKTVLCNIF